jgi:hypothetical protein
MTDEVKQQQFIMSDDESSDDESSDDESSDDEVEVEVEVVNEVKTDYSKNDFIDDLQTLMEILRKSKEEGDYIKGAGITKRLFQFVIKDEKNEIDEARYESFENPLPRVLPRVLDEEYHRRISEKVEREMAERKSRLDEFLANGGIFEWEQTSTETDAEWRIRTGV